MRTDRRPGGYAGEVSTRRAQALALFLAIGAAGASSRAPAQDAARHVFLLRPASEPAPDGFGDLLRALRSSLHGTDIDVEAVPAQLPPTGSSDAAEWGATLARSEGAYAVLWLAPPAEDESVTLFIATADPHAAPMSIQIREPNSFDRARTLALAVRPLLERLPAVPAAPRPEPSAPAGEVRAPPRPEPTPSPSPPAPVVEWPDDLAPLSLRIAGGATVRSQGPTVGAIALVELGFLRWGWAQIAVELIRPEASIEGGGTARERIALGGALGAQLPWEIVRVRLGAVASLVAAWRDGEGPRYAMTLGGTLALAILPAPELYLEIPLSVHGAVVSDDPSAVPDVELAVALVLGVCIE